MAAVGLGDDGGGCGGTGFAKTVLQAAGEFGEFGVFEEFFEREFDAEGLPDAGDDLYGE